MQLKCTHAETKAWEGLRSPCRSSLREPRPLCCTHMLSLQVRLLELTHCQRLCERVEAGAGVGLTD